MAVTLNPTDKKWHVGFTATQQELATAKKYLDRNIVIEAPTKSTIDNKAFSMTNYIKSDKDDDGTSVDTLEISLTIPAGYYETTTLTKEYTDLLPSLTGNALAPYILTGFDAYDDTGKPITGKMTNHAVLSSNSITMTASEGSASATGNLVALGTVSDDEPESTTHYIKVSGSGKVSASYNIEEGYYASGSQVTGVATSSNTKDVYYTIADANGTVSGAIESLSISSTLNSNNKYDINGSYTGNLATITQAGYADKDDKYSGTITAKGEVSQSTVSCTSSAGTGATDLTTQFETISAGYYPTDRYYKVQDAANLGLSITDQSGTQVTVGTETTNGYTLSTSLTGAVSAETAGWFKSGSWTDSSVTVGYIPKEGCSAAASADPTGEGTAPTYDITCTTAGYSTAGTVHKSITIWNGEMVTTTPAA